MKMTFCSVSPSSSLYQYKVALSLCTRTHMTQHLWQSESSLNSALFFPGGRAWAWRGREREKNDGVEWGVLEHCPALAQISRLSSLMDLAKNKRKWRPMTGG